MSERDGRRRRLFSSRWLWLLAVPLLLLTAYVLIARQLMVLVPEYRLDLQNQLQQRLGVAVRIDRLSGRLDGFLPRFRLDGVTLLTDDGEAVFHADQIEARVQLLRTLVYRQASFAELYASGVQVQVERDADGRIHLRDLDMSAQRMHRTLADMLTLLYRQQRIIVHDARVSLVGAGVPEGGAASVDLEWVNRRHHHSLALRARSAGDHPLSVQARLKLRGPSASRQDLAGRLYLQVQGGGLPHWLSRVHPWPVKLAQLDGQLRLWANFDGGVLRGGVVRLTSPKLVLTDGDERWSATDLQLAASLQRSATGTVQVTVARLRATTPAGKVAPGPMSLDWQHQDGEMRWHWRANHLALQAWSKQLEHWPFALPDKLAAWRNQIVERAPRGKVKRILVGGVGKTVARMQARFSDLAVTAAGKTPGFRGLAGWLAVTPENGKADLHADSLQLTLPRFYDHPLQAALKAAPLRWHRQDGQWQMQSGVVRVDNPDARGIALLHVAGGAGKSVPELRLLAAIHNGNGERAAHYIPLKRLQANQAELGQWLSRAFLGGTLESGRFLYQGPVDMDPDRPMETTFQMRFQGRDATLSFLPNWPPVEDVDADVLIRGRHVTGHARHGRLLHSQFSAVTVEVPAVRDRSERRIHLAGQVQGPVADMDYLFHQTPLKARLPDALQKWQFENGAVNGALQLDIPFIAGKQPPKVTFKGHVDDLTVDNKTRDLRITHLSGPVHFDLQKGINAKHLKAQVLGSQISGSWHSDDAGSRLKLAGTLAVKPLRQWLGLAWLRHATGSLPMEMTLELPWHGGALRLQAWSDLHGVQVAAPAPIGKRAGQKRPSHLTWTPVGGGRIRFHYGQIASGHLRLAPTLSGGLRLGPGSPPPIPAQGLDIDGQVERIDTHKWMDFLAGQIPDDQKAASAALVQRATIRATHLNLFGLALNNARFSAARQAGGWSLGLDSAGLAGTLTVPANYRMRGQQPLTVDLQRLIVPAITGMFTESDQPPLRPTQVPDMDVTVADLQVGEVDLGTWSAQVRPVPNGVRINQLSGAGRHIHVDGRLDWTGNDGQQHSRFYGSLSSDDLAAALTAWGLPPLLDTSDAHARVNLGWDDWPLGLDYTALRGTAIVDIGPCRIPEVEGSISGLRLLGIFNINTLQRRLRLDFSDLYKKGLSCNSISGDFRFKGPVVSSSNLHIESPSAAFAVQGQINLAKKTLDQQVKMTLPISSNLYVGCLAGPAICAGIFVVNQLFGDKLNKATTMTYRVSGSWQNPQVKEVDGMFQ